MPRADLATPADLAHCRQMIRQGSKSFHLASLLMPRRYREYARALYGFCRMADDLVDLSEHPRDAVLALGERLDAIYAGQPSAIATDRTFADLVHRFAIPRSVPDALIEGFAWDAERRRYDSYSDVVAYGVRVAGTVGVMMSLIMGRRSPAALARAIDLGVAMQLSNIARDVQEDARLGRVYIPAEWLGQPCGADRILAEPAHAAIAATMLVSRSEQLYHRAGVGIALLPFSCRPSINAARLLYREIGLVARRQNHVGRAVVSSRRKLALVCRAVAEVPILPSASAEPCLAEGQFLLDDVARAPLPPHMPRSLVGQLDWALDMLIAVEERRR